VLTSVHAFATDPARGVYILLLLVVVIGGSLTLYAVRAPGLKGGGLFAPVSREGALVLNNLLLATCAAVVTTGTLYPLVLDAIGGDKISVGRPFYNSTFVPLIVPALVACAVGAMLSWKRADLAGILGRLKFALAAAVVAALTTLWLHDAKAAVAACGMALAAWLIVGSIVEFAERIGLFRMPLADVARRLRAVPRSAIGMAVAHGALGIAVAGITAASAWQIERVQVMQPGQAIDIHGYHVVFDGVAPARGPNYTADRASFTVTRDGALVTRMHPEKRHFIVERTETTDAAIHATLGGDLYVVIGDKGTGNAWTTRIYFNPLVAWIWGGAVLMALGGGISLSDRRLRIGAPRRAARAAAAPAKA
jgi:cytochrome c-type biogenesis protein CcmF